MTSLEEITPMLIEIQGQLMRDWSEDNWAAGWMADLEMLVWEADDYDANRIKALAQVTGVWITGHYHDWEGEKPPTMPLDEWSSTEYPSRVKANREAHEKWLRERGVPEGMTYRDWMRQNDPTYPF